MANVESKARAEVNLEFASDLKAFHKEFVQLVQDSQRVTKDVLEPICADHGISQQQLLLLMVLDAEPGSRMSDVSDKLGILRTNFTQLAHKTEAMGLVKRTRGTIDRRSHTLDLTEEGKRLVVKLQEDFALRNQPISESLSAQTREDLLRGFQAMRKIVDAFKTGLPARR